MIDLEKLTPAPWSLEDRGDLRWCVLDAVGRCVPGLDAFYGARGKTIAEKIIVARNAFDIQMRRGWHAVRTDDGKKWFAFGEGIPKAFLREPSIIEVWYQDDPFTAMVEAEKWYVANVEKVEAG